MNFSFNMKNLQDITNFRYCSRRIEKNQLPFCGGNWSLFNIDLKNFSMKASHQQRKFTLICATRQYAYPKKSLKLTFFFQEKEKSRAQEEEDEAEQPTFCASCGSDCGGDICNGHHFRTNSPM